MKIPFSKITISDEELKAVEEVVKNGWIVLGPKTKEFEEKFAKYVGSKYAVFVDSGTSALALAIRAAGYKDYINIPSLTFVSDAEVVHHAGLRVKFMDVNRNTLCVDKDYVNCLPVNFAGVRAKAKGRVIDSCHRIEKNDVKGSYALWCYSFYATKNMSTGQGGMIALNDKKTYDWLLKARDHGLNKGTEQRYKGKNPFYDVEFPGYRVKGDDIRAVIGIEQLKKLPWITKERNRVVNRYNKNLNLKRKGNHIYYIYVKKREEFIEYMHDNGVQTSIHFLPIHKFTAYKNVKAKLPVTNWVGEHIVSLPIFPQMTDEEVDYVSKLVLESKLMIK